MRRPTKPRPKKLSMRLKSAMEDLVSHPPASWMIETIDTVFSPANVVAGMTYAIDGQVRVLKIREGVITASVQCTEEKPYKLQIDIPVLSSEDWVKVARRMAIEARIAARLSAGRVPSSLAGIFRDCGLEPIANGLKPVCSCNDKRPCKHAAAALFLSAERLLTMPMLFFELRGTTAEDLLGKLRQARTLDAKGQAVAHAGVRSDDLPNILPIEECLDDFWRCPRAVKEADSAPMPPHLPHALLRRLGQSTMVGKFPFAGLLETIYDDVARNATEHRRDD
jgi:uncharacterized Zn finger protein